MKFSVHWTRFLYRPGVESFWQPCTGTLAQWEGVQAVHSSMTWRILLALKRGLQVGGGGLWIKIEWGGRREGKQLLPMVSWHVYIYIYIIKSYVYIWCTVYHRPQGRALSSLYFVSSFAGVFFLLSCAWRTTNWVSAYKCRRREDNAGRIVLGKNFSGYWKCL